MKKKKLLTDRTGMLQEELLEQSAKRLAEDIDAEVLRQVYKSSGWHEVVIHWIMTHEVSSEVDKWVEEHVKGKYWNRGLVWLFKEQRDANWFVLRWGDAR